MYLVTASTWQCCTEKYMRVRGVLPFADDLASLSSCHDCSCWLSMLLSKLSLVCQDFGYFCLWN